MRSDTFRNWLAERGCRFQSHEQHGRSHGHPTVTVHREGRTAQLPLCASHEDIDPRIVERICTELGLDPAELPGPASRV
ncbi:MAG: hypothetical protein ACLQUZ_04095 [Rhizomicrobium sp.]